MAGLSTVASTRRGKISSKPGQLRQLGLGLLLVIAATAQCAVANDAVDVLLQREEAPIGVVFEIVEADESALLQLLPQVRAAITQLRQRFPQTEFAVVSHGREEFALQRQFQDEYAPIHQQVQTLVADAVPVHVCATHASWYSVTAEDFPDYVDVAPSARGQIEVYRQLGYHLILIETAG